jgi:ribonuclease VapC
MTAVLDASAILAVIFKEEGLDRVLATIGESVMSVVNLGEVLVKTTRRGMDAGEVKTLLDEFGILWTAPDDNDALVAASFPDQLGLSIGDRFCLALAAERGLPVLTSDHAWFALAPAIDVQLIR